MEGGSLIEIDGQNLAGEDQQVLESSEMNSTLWEFEMKLTLPKHYEWKLN